MLTLWCAELSALQKFAKPRMASKTAATPGRRNLRGLIGQMLVTQRQQHHLRLTKQLKKSDAFDL